MGQSATKPHMPVVTADYQHQTEMQEFNVTTGCARPQQDQQHPAQAHPNDGAYYCKLTSRKHKTLVYLATNKESAHGTTFVYYKPDKAIQLSDYNYIVCGAHQLPQSGTAFELSAVRFHSEFIHKGDTFYQFVCSTTQKENTDKLMLRTLKKTCNPTQPLPCIDATKHWYFVWQKSTTH